MVDKYVLTNGSNGKTKKRCAVVLGYMHNLEGINKAAVEIQKEFHVSFAEMQIVQYAPPVHGNMIGIEFNPGDQPIPEEYLHTTREDHFRLK